jgi:hypothetical protein
VLLDRKEDDEEVKCPLLLFFLGQECQLGFPTPSAFLRLFMCGYQQATCPNNILYLVGISSEDFPWV